MLQNPGKVGLKCKGAHDFQPVPLNSHRDGCGWKNFFPDGHRSRRREIEHGRTLPGQYLCTPLQYPRGASFCWGARNSEFSRVRLSSEAGDGRWGPHCTTELGKIKKTNFDFRLCGQTSFRKAKRPLGCSALRTAPQQSQAEKADHQGSSAAIRQLTFVHEGIITSEVGLCQSVD